MKKEYLVYADLTMVVSETIIASSEEEAMEIAEEKFYNNAFDYAKKASACVQVEVTDAVCN